MIAIIIIDHENRQIEAISQRILKTGAIIAGRITATLALSSVNGILIAGETPKKKGKWYGIGIDIDKCIGCGNCAKACKLENDVPQEPFYFRSWVEQYTTKPMEL